MTAIEREETGSIVDHIDPVSVIEICLNGTLLSLFRHHGLRHHLGFTQISPCSDEEGFPGWYLWFRGRPGAYLLELNGAEVLPETHPVGEEAASRAAMEGRFSIRYFPHVNEFLFDAFSPQERTMRTGGLFDRTGTPTFEGRSKLPCDFYVVGNMGLRVTSFGDLRQIGCVAMARRVDCRREAIMVSSPERNAWGAIHTAAQDRNIPGWELTRYLFDRLIAAFCSIRKTAPIAVSGSEGCGVTRGIGEAQKGEPEEGVDAVFFRVDVAFGVPGRCIWDTTPCLGDSGENAGRDDFRSVGLWSDPESLPPLFGDPQWWSIKDTEFPHIHDELCNCYSHEAPDRLGRHL